MVFASGSSARSSLLLAQRGLTALTLSWLALGCIPQTTPRGANGPLDPGVERGARFEVGGAPFCFEGTNNYYLAYKPRKMVDDVLESARALGLSVVRTWAFIDRGSLDGSVPNTDGEGSKGGVYFQAWDPARREPVYNDGADGLENLDYAVAKASSLGIKLLLVMTNNWREFGGIDQYLAWYGLDQHREFYRSPPVKAAFKAWLTHLMLRKNSVSGLIYRDDPSIFGWELANEPRCKGSGLSLSAACDPKLITDWASEMSAYAKSIDDHHLIAVGDEGFLNEGGVHFTYRADDGVDHRALTALPSVDFGTFHLYPETWGTAPGWDTRWIADHERIARELDKPTVLEEYGLKVERDPSGVIVTGLEQRLAAYATWNDTVRRHAGGAALFWMLAGREESGQFYPDYDHFTVYREDSAGQLLRDIARRFPSAPACTPDAGLPPLPASPFVSVRHRHGAAAR